ncbi:hypothetical protein D1007_53111 [Hordeum vulgare]|nr:hypothetical protein D1007_53111 [Hordeum vulgare]
MLTAMSLSPSNRSSTSTTTVMHGLSQGCALVNCTPGYRAMADDDPRVPGHRTMADDEEEQMPFFSQFSSRQQAIQGSSAGGNLGRGMGFGRFLDLNSNVDDFPELGSYQQLLFDQSAGHGLPTVGPGREDVDENEGFEDEDDNNAFGEEWLGQQTGCGRTGDGAITASNEWWKKIIKERPDVRKFKGGNPEYLDMLIEIFQGVAVDGSSAYVPLDEDEEEEYDVADDGNEQSPMSTTSKKRGSSDGEQSASSPGKKHKSPMVKLMTGLINTINSDNTSDMITEYANKRQEAKDKAREKKSNNTKESITHCQLLAVQCGVEETSVEYFMATQLFADEANRVIFENISTNEARLTWLKRWCMMMKLY